MNTVIRLKKRQDFVRLNHKGRKFITKGFVLLALSRDEDNPFSDIIRVGFTTTKKLGKAVIRNRIRRRLRAVVQKVMPKMGQPSCDYVLIGRTTTNDCSFERLIRDLTFALEHI